MIAKRHVTLLIIDDDPDDRYAIARLAREIVYWEVEILEAKDRPDAISVLESRVVDVIILDYLLGKETGLEVLHSLCQDQADCPVVVTTGQGDEHVAAEFMKAGAQDYLIKSELTPHLLHRALDRAIAQTVLQREKALLEDQVRHLHKMEAVSTLAGGLAHDFNNILTGIIGHVQLGQFSKDPVKIHQHLEAVERDCHRMSAIIRRLMSLNDPGTSRRRSLSLRQVVEEMRVLLEHQVGPNVKLELRLGTEPLPVEGSVASLHQIITNIVTNAIEAMSEGGTLTLTTGIRDDSLALNSGGQDLGLQPMAYLEIRDTGHGIDEDIQRRIFEPFFTTKPLTSVKGSGLGLAVVWQVVRSLGGTVRVDSSLGQGAAFTIYLPVAGPQPPVQHEPVQVGSIHDLDAD